MTKECRITNDECRPTSGLRYSFDIRHSTFVISGLSHRLRNAMYIPAAFHESDRAKLFDFIEQNSFGLLVSQVDQQPFATHLPLLLDRSTGPQGSLLGHVARPNPQW